MKEKVVTTFFFVLLILGLVIIAFEESVGQKETKTHVLKPTSPLSPTGGRIEGREGRLNGRGGRLGGETEYFNGYECTGDCSGHEAGWAWAENKGIEDASDCSGKSTSFIEGCEAYVESTQNYSY